MTESYKKDKLIKILTELRKAEQNAINALNHIRDLINTMEESRKP